MKSDRRPLIQADFDEKEPPRNPAAVAADILVERALQANPAAYAIAEREGAVVVVQVAATAWAMPIYGAWMRAFFGYKSDAVDGPHGGRSGLRFDIIAADRDSARRSERERDLSLDAMCAAASGGDGALAVAADLKLLPSQLLAAADLVVEVPGLDTSVLADLAKILKKTGSAVEFSAIDLSAITPESIRLASRPVQSCAEFERQIRRQVEAAAPQPQPKARWTLDTLPLSGDISAWGHQLSEDLSAFREGRLRWSEIDRGALLVGPPGTGKTTFAGALAASCGVPLVIGGYSTWEADGKHSEIISRIRASFAEARAKAPSILFLDEVDSFIPRGGAGHNESWFRPLVNALLAEMDGLEGREGIVVLAATNDSSSVDAALRRSGRLDRELQFRLPDMRALEQIFSAHLGIGGDFTRAAHMSVGSSGADCERLARCARRRARAARRPVSVLDLVPRFGIGDRNRGPAGAGGSGREGRVKERRQVAERRWRGRSGCMSVAGRGTNRRRPRREQSLRPVRG